MVLRLGRRPAILGDEVAGIEGSCIRLRAGGLRCIIATSSLNFVSMAADEQDRTVRAFVELLHAQTGPLQIYFRSKRVAPATSDPEPLPEHFSGRPSYLAALTRSFINRHLSDTTVYQRDIYVVLPADEPADRGIGSLLSGARRRVDPRAPSTADLRYLEDRAAAVIEQLRHLGLQGRVLQREELSRLLLEPYETARNRPPIVQHRPSRVSVEGRHYTAFVIDQYPGGTVDPGWLLPLLMYGAELRVAIHVVPLETERVLTLLHHRIRDMRADEMAEVDSGAIGDQRLATLPDALSVHQALVRNEEKAFAVGFYFTVAADRLEELRAHTLALRTICRRLMVRVVQPFFQMPQALVSTWPLGADLLGRERLLHSSAVSTLLPWLQADLQDADGHYWGLNRQTGGLVVFDPFDERRFANANIAVLAHSGAGKTYAAGSLVLSGYTRGLGAVILDPEAEYERMVRSVGGTYLHLAAGSGHAINVLDSLSGEDAADQVGDVLDLVSLMCGRLDEVERAQLEEAVREATTGPGPPVLGDVGAALERAYPGARAVTILRRWAGGELGQLFSAPTNVDLHADVIGFNVRDLKDEVVAPVYLLLANWLWGALRRDRRPRHLLIDEAGLLLEHEPIRRFLVRLARRIRKYQGSLILVSQNPGDFFETKDGAVLATNPSILLLGSQKHSEALKLQKAFSLTDRQVTYLEMAQRGEFLLLAGSSRVPLRVMAPPWMDGLIVPPRAAVSPRARRNGI